MPTRNPQLTKRERELLAAIVDGKNNRQIATALRISEQTVRNQLSVLYEKFGVRSRLQLAVRALREKLVG